MANKERIMDLLRRGVITADEATELLEKSGESADGVKSGEDFTYKDKDGYVNHDVDFADAMKNVFTNVAEVVSTAAKGLSKTVGDTFEWEGGVPKFRRTKKTVEKDIEGAFDSVELSATAGTVKFAKGDNAHVKVEYTVYGAVDDIDSYLSEKTRLDAADDRLYVTADSNRISIDAEIYLPERDYKEVAVNLLNGDLSVENLSAEKLELSEKNGKLTVRAVKAGELKLDLINGEIKFDGSFEKATANLVNGNILLTQRDTRARELNAKTVNGDVKLAVPEALGLVGRVKTTFGGYKTRVKLDSDFEPSKNGATLVRQASDSLTFELETKSGTLWLKDNGYE